ncbi:MAG TPA: proton-conducting transporter membrane subunit [Novimethylophilus sp.]|jgi:hydrogenase-4 component B|uniref:proton-conducting transporter transmembrane domain-containing protein n=1 Tax=Novimethylophilus sp. TaxID=2137426 RepID=UPI002F3FAA21
MFLNELVLSMSLPEIPGGFAVWCDTALFVWLAVVLVGVLARRANGVVFPVLTALGSLFLLITATVGGNGDCTIPLPYYLGNAPLTFVFDPLSRWFLAIIAIIGCTTAFFAPGYLEHLRQRVALGFVWAGIALLFISMVGVVLAGNAIAFLVAWELMALSSFALVASDHTQQTVRRAALIYLGATRIGTAFLMAGFLWAHQLTGSWTFADWGLSGAVALGPALLILVGLATKAGSWPFHLWLPIAHPAAPAPVSAIMSGVMIKTAIYAMVRLYVVGDHLTAPALGPIILIFGAISALWGVLFALLQNDLKRLLAYSSIENIGIILMGIGIALIGKQQHLPYLAQIGLAAALFHSLNHALFKSLLFYGAGAIDMRTHLRDIEQLGGLIHRMPWTTASFVAGCAAICALPPMNGFASEWLLYQGFFALALHGPLAGVRLAALLLMGWLALIGGLAIACFVKVVGVAFLGAPRSKAAEHATEIPKTMLIAQGALVVCCIGLGIAVPTLLLPLDQLVRVSGEPQLLASAWSIPMPALVALAVGTLSVLTLALAHLARRQPARRFITWECGFGTLGPRTQYTATSFAQPISRLFSLVYRYVVDITVKGRNRHHFPSGVSADATHEPYLETRVYTPLARAILRVAGSLLLRLQAGSIHQYLLYMAAVLALLLWLGVRQ